MTTTAEWDEYEEITRRRFAVVKDPASGFTVTLTLHLRDARTADEALEQAMRWRDAIGCPELDGTPSRDEALGRLDFDWHLHHPWGC